MGSEVPPVPAGDLSAVQRELAMKALPTFLTGALAAGVGVRGATGLYNLVRRNLAPPEQKKSPGTPGQISLPYAVPSKMASETPPPNPVGSLFNADWWTMPTYVLGGAGAYATGHKLMDYLMDNRRQAAMKNEVERARNEFDTTLQQGIASPRHAQFKMAEDTGKMLDEIYDLMAARTEKQAGLGNSLAGMYLTALAASAAAGGLGGYHWAQSNSQASLVDRAAKERRRRLMQVNPAEVVPEAKAEPMLTPA